MYRYNIALWRRLVKGRSGREEAVGSSDCEAIEALSFGMGTAERRAPQKLVRGLKRSCF